MRAFFKEDKFAKSAGIEIIEITKKLSLVRAKITAEHLNSLGTVQGGMLYTVADFAFAVLANYLHPETVTQCGNITYIRPAITSEVTAIAKEIECVGRTCIVEVTVKDDKGDTVCVCHFNGFIKEMKKES